MKESGAVPPGCAATGLPTIEALPSSVAALSDRELLDETERLATAERASTVRLLAALGELEQRRLYLEAGCSSLFTYCTNVLRLSEHAAYRRIQAARAARTFPSILRRLASGSLTLTAVGLLAPHLTGVNGEALLDEAHHRAKREIEEILARVAPKPDAPEMIRRLPAPRQASCACQGPVTDGCETHALTLPTAVDLRHIRDSSDEPVGDEHAPEPPSGLKPELGPDATGGRPDRPGGRASSAPSPQTELVGPGAPPTGEGRAASSAAGTPRPPDAVRERPAVLEPLAPGRYRVQLTISAVTYSKLRRVQDLMRHLVPDGNLEAVFDRAITELLDDLERARLAAALHPRDSAGAPTPGSRHVPAAVKRAVWTRDAGRCAFVGTAGRCRETGFLQFHHRKPFAVGGETTAENLELRCAAHNAFEAELFFGQLGDGVHAPSPSGGSPEPTPPSAPPPARAASERAVGRTRAGLNGTLAADAPRVAAEPRRPAAHVAIPGVTSPVVRQCGLAVPVRQIVDASQDAVQSHLAASRGVAASSPPGFPAGNADSRGAAWGEREPPGDAQGQPGWPGEPAVGEDQPCAQDDGRGGVAQDVVAGARAAGGGCATGGGCEALGECGTGGACGETSGQSEPSVEATLEQSEPSVEATLEQSEPSVEATPEQSGPGERGPRREPIAEGGPPQRPVPGATEPEGVLRAGHGEQSVRLDDDLASERIERAHSAADRGSDAAGRAWPSERRPAVIGVRPGRRSGPAANRRGLPPGAILPHTEAVLVTGAGGAPSPPSDKGTQSGGARADEGRQRVHRGAERAPP